MSYLRHSEMKEMEISICPKFRANFLKGWDTYLMLRRICTSFFHFLRYLSGLPPWLLLSVSNLICSHISDNKWGVASKVQNFVNHICRLLINKGCGIVPLYSDFNIMTTSEYKNCRNVEVKPVTRKTQIDTTITMTN